MSVISELRRRNVLRMLVLYVVAAWLIMQVAEVVIALANLPEWIGPGILVLLAVGLPIALTFSWFYELTPDGMKLEKDVDPAVSISNATSRRLDFLVISLLCAAVILFAYDKWWMSDPSDRSVAVLPFVAMSSGEDDGYFADGLTEDILNSLAQISDLKVAGRTSSFYYKGKTPNFEEVGKALGVAHVLEGTVRRAGNQLRITAQLINAADGFNLWSASYDRSMDDIFAIQADIAKQVTAALQVTLLGEEAEALSQHGTTNVAAQSRYLIASGYIRHGTDMWVDAALANVHLRAARRLLEEAVELDPDFAEAWAKLVPAYHLLGGYYVTDGSGDMLTVPQATALVGPAADRAIKMAPNLPEAWVAMGIYKQRMGDVDQALMVDAKAAFETALRLDADNLTTLQFFAAYWFNVGEYAAATALLDRALELDPSSTVRLRRAQATYYAGRADEARQEYLEVARLYPDAPFKGGIAEIEFDRGHFHHGLVWLGDSKGAIPLPFAWVSLGDTERGLEIWSAYKTVGGRVAKFAELGDYFFLRDYEGLETAAANATDYTADFQFLLPSLQYLRRWEDAISIYKNWPADFPLWPTHLEDITGTGGASDRRFKSQLRGAIATQAAYYAHSLASVGRRADAEPVWSWALELGSRNPVTTPRLIQERHHLRLLVFASRGEKEAALLELEAMVDAGWRWLMSPGNMDWMVYSVGNGWFEDSPLLDSIRDEPRFIAAVKKVTDDSAAMLAELNAGLTLEDIMDEDVD